MARDIPNPETERLAREVAALTGETEADAVTVALRERLARLRSEQDQRSLADELDGIALHCATLPVLDSRPDEEILGNDGR